MIEYNSVVTRKGQVTVPAEVRKALGLKEGDKVTFVLEEGSAKLTKWRSVVERTAGIFYTGEPPLTAEELRRVAEESAAEEVEERSRR